MNQRGRPLIPGQTRHWWEALLLGSVRWAVCIFAAQVAIGASGAGFWPNLAAGSAALLLACLLFLHLEMTRLTQAVTRLAAMPDRTASKNSNSTPSTEEEE